MGTSIDQACFHRAKVLLHLMRRVPRLRHLACQRHGIRKSLSLRGRVRRASESQRSRTFTLEIGTTCETSCRSRTVGPRFRALAGATPRG
jgi:hypothetical protein